MWFQKILVRFFMSIDKTLYSFISTLYDLLIAISRTSVLSQGDIAQFATRIEILLGIFMLFKLSFSLITYIVNPDDFTDGQKGFGKLVQNSIISLTMLVLVPYAFQLAFNLQARILNDNVLAKLLLGEKIMHSDEIKLKSTEEDGDDEMYTSSGSIINSAGDELAFLVMIPLFTPNYSVEGLETCVNLYDGDGSTFNQACYDTLKKLINDADADDDENDDERVSYIDNYKYGIENESLGLTFRKNIALLSKDDNFLIDYKYPISTAVAVITCLLLITFCIDVGVRSIKLAMLQLIYPIPVISFMDPKSGKDGLFSKWYKMCLSTFLSLFIRLLALYFGIYVVSKVGRHGMVDIINGSEITNGWAKLFIVIGMLMFIKQMPKILENLGIKLDGDGKFTLNPLKKLEEGALGGKQIIGTGRKIAKGAGKFAAVGIGGAAAVGGASLITGKGLRGTANAIKSAIGGGLKGNKFGKNFTSSYSAGAAKKREIRQRRNDGVSSTAVARDKLYSAMHGQTRSDRIGNVSDGLKAIEDEYKNYESTAAGVDAIAKDFDKRRKAAEAAGDYAESNRWSKAFDTRIKQIAANGGQVVTDVDSSWDFASHVGTDGSYTFGQSDAIAHAATADKVEINAGLKNTQDHIDSMVSELNKAGQGVKGYIRINGSTTTDIKSVKNQAKGSQQSVDTNSKNRHYKDVSKYSGSKKQ